MKALPLIVGGIVAGLFIVAGEAVLNLAILADDWHELFARLALPQPTAGVAAQGLLKLLLLGVFSVWLAVTFKRPFPLPSRAPLMSGLTVWFLVWAWVQWGMLLAGYVTTRIAATTVVWGLFELPFAVWAGTWVYERVCERLSGARLVRQ